MKKIFRKKKWLYSIGLLGLSGILLLSINFLLEIETRGSVVRTTSDAYEETIIAVADMDFEPYSFLDTEGNMVGADVEILHLLADKLGKNIEIQLMKWPDAINAVKNGEADLIIGVDYRPGILDGVELTVPIHSDPFVAFSDRELHRASELHNMRIGALDQSNSFSAFLIPHRLVDNVIAYPTYTDAFNALAQGEVDVCIASYSVGMRATAKLKHTGIKATGPQLASSDLSIGISAYEDHIAEDINEAILALIRDGSIEEVDKKWLGRYIETVSFQAYLKANAVEMFLAMLVVGGSIIVMVIIFYQMRLKALNAQRSLERGILAYRQFVTGATRELFEGVYEVNVTDNLPMNTHAKQLWESVDGGKKQSYNEVLKQVAEAFIGKAHKKLFYEIYCAEHIENLYLADESQIEVEFQALDDLGKLVWYKSTAKVFRWNEQEAFHLLVFLRNIDEQKKEAEKLRKEACQDAMTGLYNKTTTESIIAKMLDSGIKQGALSALLLLDIDNFKMINDTLGHAFGDLAIIQFSEKLQASVGAKAVVGRIGGDEFAVFVTGVATRGEVEKLAAHLSCQLNCTVVEGGKYKCVSASIGVALVETGVQDFVELYRVADQALYAAKRAGRNCYVLKEYKAADSIGEKR